MRRRARRRKDAAISAVILCAASVAWFGWGHQPGRLPTVLTTGSVLAAAATIWCLVTAVRTPGPATMSTDPRARRIWWAALLVEAVAITAGAVLLARTGGQHWLSSWALAVVSLHFLPLARAFRLGVLTAVTVAGLAAAAAAVAAQLSGVLPAGTVAGLGGGVVLLLGGLVARATR